MELVLSGKHKEAEALWKKWLQKSPVLVFRRLLQESHTRKQPEIIENLINVLKTNKTISHASIGNAYSRLINFYLSENKPQEAENALSTALKSGLNSEHLNKTTLTRLKTLVEESGGVFKYSI